MERKGTAMAFNGGASKRRPRGGKSRDSPDMERLGRDRRRNGVESSEGEEEEYEGDDVSVRRNLYSQNYKIHPQKQRNCLSDKISISVPRKARTVSKKRMSNDWLESFHIKNSGGRKKMKSMNGTKQKPKISKQPSFIEDELEVAEFLFGLTRHFNQEKNGNNETKSQENNSNSNSNPNIAQKKKRTAILKSKEEEDNNNNNTVSVASTSKTERDESDKKPNTDPLFRNGFQSTQREPIKEQDKRESLINGAKQHFFPFSLNSDRSNNNRDQSDAKTGDFPAEKSREPKHIITLMGPPRGDGLEKKARGPDIETASKSSSERREAQQNNALAPDLLCKERFLNLEFDQEKSESNNAAFGSRNRAEPHQPKAGNSKAESKQDKDKAGPPGNIAMQMGMGAWPGNLPPIGFMGQVPLPLPPGLHPFSINPTSNNLQARAPRGPPLHRPKRCLTHLYLAKLTDYHQQLLKMNPFSAGPPAGAPRPPTFNLGLMPPNSDPSLLQMQANYNANQLENNKPCSNNNNNSNNVLENQRKQQMAQSGQMANMMHGPPTFMFPMNQQQAAAAMAAAMAATANRPNNSVSTNGSSPPGRPMNLTMPGLPTVDPQILAAFKNGTYPFPVPGPAGMPGSYRGGPHSNPWPFFPPQMAPHQQLMPPHQQFRPNVGPAQNPVQKSSGNSFGENRPGLSPNQVNQQDGDKNIKGFNNNSNNNNSQVQKNVYGQNYTMPFAFNAPRPAITRHHERTEEHKEGVKNQNATSAKLHQNATSASSKLLTVNNNNNNNSNKPSPNAATSAPLQQQMLIQLQKQQQQLMQEHQILSSRNKNAPPGGLNNNSSDFSQVIKTAFPHAIIKRMESQSQSPSSSKNNSSSSNNNNNNNNNPHFSPQSRNLLAGSNASKTAPVGLKQPASPSTKSNNNINNNNNTHSSPPSNMTSKNGSLTKSPLTPAQQHSVAKTNSPSIPTPRPPAVLKNPNNLSPHPNPNNLSPRPNPNISLPKPNHNQNSSPKDPKQQIYPRPQFFYPQQMQPYANGPQKQHKDNPGPAGLTVHHRVAGPGVGPAQPMTGGAHARVPVSFAYLPMVGPVLNKGAADQKQAGGK